MKRIPLLFRALARFARLVGQAIVNREADCLRRAETAHKEAAESLIRALRRDDRLRGVAGEDHEPVIFNPRHRRLMRAR